MSRCAYEWWAPYLSPPGTPNERQVEFGGVRVTVKGNVSIKQKCSQPKGHDGPHRSSTNVIVGVAGRDEPESKP